MLYELTSNEAYTDNNEHSLNVLAGDMGNE